MYCDLYLSYSGRKTYLDCPSKYHHQYIIKTPCEIDPRDTIFGSTIQLIFEWFYNKQIWSYPNVKLELIKLIDPAIESISSKNRFYPSSDYDFFKNLRLSLTELVPKNVDVISKFKLLSTKSRSEEDLSIYYHHKDFDLTLKIGGRTDFIHHFNDDDVWILDGKGSYHRDKYSDNEQLIWYAFQHYMKYHIIPTRLGFHYWRFPDNPIDWIDFNEYSLRQSLKKTFQVAKAIKSQKFEPEPGKACFLCNFKKHCSVGSKYINDMDLQAKEDLTTNSIFGLEEV